MQKELIEAILIPKRHDWIVLKTDKQSYCLRLGGVSICEPVDLAQYETADLPLARKQISAIYTDNFLVLIETVEGDALQHSPDASINSEGETSFGIKYLTKEQCQELKMDYKDLLNHLTT